MNFTVYKSSAGSGKTYTLVKEYLKIALVKPDQYRHVLAITFTNKAANEMKERIVRVLKDIVQYDPAANSGTRGTLVVELKDETGLDIPVLIKHARLVLDSIIHNYSEFAVNTIDSFIHRVIKSFAFDLNLPVNFEVEIDGDEVMRQVIDRMISRAGADADLTRFLVDFVVSRTEEEKNWNIESDLLKMAKILRKEDSGEHLKKNAHLELKDYMRINADIQRYLAGFEKRIHDLGRKGMELIQSRGIPPSSFYRGETGIYSYFRYLATGRFDKRVPSATLQNAMADDKWFSAKAPETDRSEINSIKPVLHELYEQIQARIGEDQQNYTLFQEVRKNLQPLAILGKIKQLLDEFKSENNILLISEFNQLIAEIVLDEPVPFIYERVGEKFNHFLVDEFQDTSVMQWQNLLPLIDNSLAQGSANLVVGDAKQAIYRWRNGEVEQFVQLPEIYKMRPGQVHHDRERSLMSNYQGRMLNANYRSSPGIVEFNNEFFSFIGNQLPENEARIYEGVRQEIASDKKGGFVQIEFFPPGRDDISFEDFNCMRIHSLIADLLEQGYRHEDIAILCRTNNAAGITAKFLLKHNIQVVSSESMLLENSPEVRLIISALSVLINPGNELAATEMVNLLLKLGKISGNLHGEIVKWVGKHTGKGVEPKKERIFAYLGEQGFNIHRKTYLSLPLYDLCENLIRVFDLHRNVDPFLQFFLDVILDQEKESKSGIRKFLEFWSGKKHTLSIVVPEGLDAVRIMTIHKAKGLEFPVVICPFVNEPLKKTLDTVWLDLDNEIVPSLKSVLVNANKSIQDSKYGGLVTREIEKSRLDMINLLYVAFTRPTDQLLVIADHPENMRNAAQSVPALLVDYLKGNKSWDENKFIYRSGFQIHPGKQLKKSGSSYRLMKFNSSDWRSRAMISYQAPVNWEVEDPEKRQEWGTLIHKVLSNIRVADDLNGVVDKFLFDGLINQQESGILLEIIREFLSKPGVNGFFVPELNVLTEREIIAPGGHIFRPDRIIFDQNRVIVIDFKTGFPSARHKEQVSDYVQVLHRMGHEQVSGVLLYIGSEQPVFFL